MCLYSQTFPMKLKVMLLIIQFGTLQEFLDKSSPVLTYVFIKNKFTTQMLVLENENILETHL